MKICFFAWKNYYSRHKNKMMHALQLSFLAEPRLGVVEKIARRIVDQADRAQVDEHHALDLADDKKAGRTFITGKTNVSSVAAVKKIGIFIVVYYGHESSLRPGIRLNKRCLNQDIFSMPHAGAPCAKARPGRRSGVFPMHHHCRSVLERVRDVPEKVFRLHRLVQHHIDLRKLGRRLKRLVWPLEVDGAQHEERRILPGVRGANLFQH